jgi:peroxiredoxin
MNILKSVFISGFMMLSAAIVGVAFWMLFRGGSTFGWIGVILTTAPFIIVISWLMATKSSARTSANFPVVNIAGAVGVGLAGWAWFQEDVGLLAPTLALAGWTGFLLYAYWYSRLERKPSGKLEVGKQLPRFTLKDVDGNSMDSADLVGTPAILLFYRGNWCPLCMAQIKELAGRYRELAALGVRIALISPQPHSNTVELAKKFNVKFDFLTDEGNAAARILGIESENGIPMGMQMMGYESETVLPTVIITDQTGKIIWTHETDNYRIRPEPDVFLDVLRRHGLSENPGMSA